MLPKIDLFGVSVTNATLEEIVHSVREQIRQGAQGKTLVGINVHTYTTALNDRAYRQALNEAFIAWPDGVPISWAAHWTRRPVGPRIHGHDLMVRFFQEPISHFFYGSTPEVLAEIRRRLVGIRIAGTFSPPRMTRIERSDVSRINDSGADIVWVALGAPKQELWSHRNADQIRVPVIASVGAAFEIITGRFRRAPRSAQQAGLEWVWRLAQDPARMWRRYFATNGYFISYILRNWIVDR